MRKIIVFTISVLLFACNTNTQPVPPEADLTTILTTDSVSQDDGDGHNAKNSLDYIGKYTGVLPTASGAGMEVTIVLIDDSVYTKDVIYIDGHDKFSSKGKYQWNKSGTTVTLIGEDKPNEYFVGENFLAQMDEEGNRITGETGNAYILKK